MAKYERKFRRTARKEKPDKILRDEIEDEEVSEVPYGDEDEVQRDVTMPIEDKVVPEKPKKRRWF